MIRHANHYDTVVRLLTLGRDRAIRQMTAEMAQIQPGDSVLDVGCGTGDLTLVAKAWAGPTGSVYGIDAAPEMIAVARRKAAQAGVDVDFQVGLIEDLSFPDRHFDVVLSSLMMHHLPGDLKRRGLAEIYRVLKPGGRLLIVDLKRPTSHASRALMALLLHRGMHSGVQDLAAILEEVGFADVEAGETRFGVLGFVRGRTRP
jgi:demethylmenaquinone methyltransferase/2-methoxy-6-polyprenyl-1,4-benzoquinol methylase/phosphoethanolamine N-methyltransferase